MPTFHVVSHTHWDREWYHPAERFRQRLVDLVDELLDDPPVEGASFLLDGQAVVLEDYLAVRPERAAELADALRRGTLEAGPWYVLADELIPSGDGLVRNLLAGQRVLQGFGAPTPPALYCPDSFGHPAALPEVARGFDKPLVIVWRGFGGARWPDGNVFRWVGPDGQEVFLYHLTRSGYELASSLPADEKAARERWTRMRQEFGTRAGIPVELLLNGADHHARQRDLDRAVALLEQAAAPESVVAGSLSAFAREVASRVPGVQLPKVSGELRDSYGFTWTLQGTLASRTPQKRMYVIRERELLRDVEPWVALATLRGAPTRRHLTRAAWQSLLLCQPHDTLCGCSIDQVADAMDGRLAATASQAEGLRQDALFALIGHDQEAARNRPSEWTPTLLVRNRAPRARSGVAIVEISVKVADVPVGPGSAPPRRQSPVKTKFANVAITHERTESPRAYPDNDAVVRFSTALWVNDVPACGIAGIPADAIAVSAEPPVPVVAGKRSMTNGVISVHWDARGHVTLEDPATGRIIRDALGWESREDVGDLYTPAIRKAKLRPKLVSTRVLERGPLMGVVEQTWRFSARRQRVDLQCRLVLEAGAPFIRIAVLGDNAARDHRLRLLLRTDVSRGRTFADAAFGVVERRPIKVPSRAARMEAAVPSAPLHRYVSLFDRRKGATLFSDGLTEYETTRDSIFVTLVRSVGELSRNDLPERPGHAGWPASTPRAQCIGPFHAELAVMLHGPRTAPVIDQVERTADDVLHPLTGHTLRSALRPAGRVEGIALEGAGLSFSCMKESEDGGWTVLRCVNLLETRVPGAWRFGSGVTIREARLARLDETPLDQLPVRDNAVSFDAPPRAVVTVLVR